MTDNEELFNVMFPIAVAFIAGLILGMVIMGGRGYEEGYKDCLVTHVIKEAPK